MAGGTASWQSQRQIVVAQSTEEAEFVTLSVCMCEVLSFEKFEHLLQPLVPCDDVDRIFRMSIAEDCQACITEATRPIILDLSKHIDFKFRFLVDDIRKESVKIHYVRSEDMRADLFTKKLPRATFRYLLDLMNMV